MKSQFAVFAFFCHLSLSACSISSYLTPLFFLCSHAKFKSNEAYLEPAQLIRKWGYPSETHVVQTEDGYLLSMNRIPHGISGNKTSSKGPVYLQHGLLGQSLDWLLLKPKKALAFLLADEGYDVWLGNFRGNTHSRAHISLTPSDTAFWNYTWHESGMYDVSAMIDFVLKTSKATKLEYMGHSMGTTAFLVLMSMRPEYNGKISKAHLLGPVAFLKNMKSPLVRIFAHLSKVYNKFSELFTSGALLPDNDVYKILRRLACDFSNLERDVCGQLTFLISGSDSKQFDKGLIGALAYHYPAGYSVKGVNHYAQVYLSGEFKQYDYGYYKNKMHYGRAKPPSYSLEKVTAPIILYSGLNDYLSTMDDAKLIIGSLPSPPESYVVDYPKFNHMDFIFAIDAKTLLYDKIIQRMTKVNVTVEKMGGQHIDPKANFARSRAMSWLMTIREIKNAKYKRPFNLSIWYCHSLFSLGLIIIILLLYNIIICNNIIIKQ